MLLIWGTVLTWHPSTATTQGNQKQLSHKTMRMTSIHTTTVRSASDMSSTRQKRKSQSSLGSRETMRTGLKLLFHTILEYTALGMVCLLITSIVTGGLMLTMSILMEHLQLQISMGWIMLISLVLGTMAGLSAAYIILMALYRNGIIQRL